MSLRSAILSCLAALMLLPSLAAADVLTDVGLRAGFDARAQAVKFRQYEIYARTNLPWQYRWRSGWQLTSELEGSAALLHASTGGNAALLSLGPALSLSRINWPLSLEIGVEPSYLSRYQFTGISLGGHIQFVSHISVRYRISPHFTLAYRFQHMSDAGIKEPNPGVNLHVLELDYRY